MFSYLFMDSYRFLMFKGFNFMLFYANSLVIQKLFVNLQPKTNKDWLWQDRLKKHRFWRVKMQSVSAGTWTTRHQYQKRRKKGHDRHTKCLSIIHQTVLCSDEPLQYIYSGTDTRDRSYYLQVCRRRLERFRLNILTSIHPYTPSLSPSLARGMFRFGDMVSGVSFQQVYTRASRAVMIDFLLIDLYWLCSIFFLFHSIRKWVSHKHSHPLWRHLV